MPDPKPTITVECIRCRRVLTQGTGPTVVPVICAECFRASLEVAPEDAC